MTASSVKPAAPAVGATGSRTLAEAGALAVVLGWGSTAVVLKWAITEVPPILFTTGRFAVGFLVMLALLRWREGSVGIARRDLLPFLLLGLAGYGIYQDLWVTGMGQTTVSNSSIITASSPVWTMLIAASIGSDSLSSSKVVGAVISFGGVVLVVGATHGFGFSGASAGDLITLVSAVVWAGYVAFGAPVMARYSALRSATWTIGLGLLGMVPLALLQAGSLDTSRLTVGMLGAFAFCAIVGAAFSNVMLIAVVAHLGPTRTMSFLFLVPAVTVALAAVFLGERIVIGQLLGGLIVIAGILVSRTGGTRRVGVELEGSSAVPVR